MERIGWAQATGLIDTETALAVADESTYASTCLAVETVNPHGVAALSTLAPSATCSGPITNGTRPGQDYASIKMNSTSASAIQCQAICCEDPKCHTWVYVPDGLYPNRPPGTFCWLKAANIPLQGERCDNGKLGCVSGTMERS